LKARRLFGSYQADVETAGYDYTGVRLTHSTYTKEDIVKLLRELAKARPDASLTELNASPARPAM